MLEEGTLGRGRRGSRTAVYGGNSSNQSPQPASRRTKRRTSAGERDTLRRRQRAPSGLRLLDSRKSLGLASVVLHRDDALVLELHDGRDQDWKFYYEIKGKQVKVMELTLLKLPAGMKLVTEGTSKGLPREKPRTWRIWNLNGRVRLNFKFDILPGAKRGAKFWICFRESATSTDGSWEYKMPRSVYAKIPRSVPAP